MSTYDEEKEKWRAAMVAKGHAPRMDDDGIIDIWALDYEYHNGPMCENCGESWCEHCSGPEEVGPCRRPTLELAAVEVVGRLPGPK